MIVTHVDEVRADEPHRNGVSRITIACTGVAAARFSLCLHVKSRHLGDAYRYPTHNPDFMLNRLRSTLFGPPHVPKPGSHPIAGLDLILTCDDTSATQTLRLNGKRRSYPSTMWTGATFCELVGGELDFTLLCESAFPRESDVERIRSIATHPTSIEIELHQAAFDFFDRLRTEHSVDFSSCLPKWSHDSVIDSLGPPSALIDDLDDTPSSRNAFLVSYSTDLDPEHGVDILVKDWTVTDCGHLI
ncbi:hypothetical protein LF1_56060 [Rubripirellula obstinata]|uniref:DUF6985 domain-containing protein n=1 Tax=Rubripirellula obstinata TaxID=406547 RepID=A0A5B1C9L5_9BACT|nr:hypothetical protein LF1_56060 [Rubripirellula obstinata]